MNIENLSRSNAEDVLSILQKRDHLKHSVVTTDGKICLSDELLKEKVHEELKMNKRMKILSLAQMFCVNLEIMEKIVRKICDETYGKKLMYLLVSGEVLQSCLMEKYLQEVNDWLQLHRKVTILEIQERFSLPRDFLIKNIEDNLENIINGYFLDSTTLITTTYEDEQREKILGIFTAIVGHPVALSSIASRHGFEMSKMTTYVQELISQDLIQGVLTGGTYIPTLFTIKQQEWLSSFIDQNRYLDYSLAKELGIKDINIKCDDHVEGQHLLNLFIAQNLIVQIDNSFVENLNVFGIFDFFDLECLPSCVTIEDLIILKDHLTLLTSHRSSVIMITDTIASKASFIEKCCDRLRAPLQSIILTRQQELHLKTKKLFKDKKSKIAMSDDMRKALTKILLKKSEEELKAMPNLDAHLIEPLSVHIIKIIEKETEKMDAQHMNQIDQIQRFHSSESIETKIIEIYNNVTVFKNGLQLFYEIKNVSKLYKYFFETVVSETMGLLTQCEAVKNNISINKEELIKSAYRLEIQTQFATEKKRLFSELETIVQNQNDPNLFCEKTEELFKMCGIYFAKLERRRERALIKKIMEPFEEQLEKNLQTEPASVLHLLSLILFNRTTGRIITANGRCVPVILTYLSTELSPELFLQVKNVQQHIIKLYSSKTCEKEKEELATMLHIELPRLQVLLLQTVSKNNSRLSSCQ